MITESGKAPPPAEDGRQAETQSFFEVRESTEEFEIVEDDEIMIAIDEQTIAQEEIFVQHEIMDPEMEEFVEGILQEDDVICCLCEGSSLDFFGGERVQIVRRTWQAY